MIAPRSSSSPVSPAGVLLCNIGSPDAPTPAALRRYLAQFLGDRRIVEAPRWLWLPVLHGVLLNTRPARSARLYQKVWSPAGAPLLAIARRQQAGLQALLETRLGAPVPVALGMSYGQPSMAAGLETLIAAGVQRLLIFPLFPQYSATTTAACLDAVFAALGRRRWLPEIHTLNHYPDHPGYIAALAASLRAAIEQHGRPSRWLFSFHGIPRSYADAGDPYPAECQATARLTAAALGLRDDEWAVAFQSRFGPAEWLQPYTTAQLTEWGRAGVQNVHVVCPGFSADCLETLDEIGREARHTFEAAGGRGLVYVPALNDQPAHLEALAELAAAHLRVWPAAAAEEHYAGV